MNEHGFFDELFERNAALCAENEKLRAQVAELLPWAATGTGRIMWDIGGPYGGTVASTYVLLTPEDGRALSARIEAGEFGEVAQ